MSPSIKAVAGPACTLAVLLAVFGADQVQAQIADSERRALIRFYQATGGDEWKDNTLWLSDPGTECNWLGVQCAMQHTDNPFVLRIILPDNNLSGRLPDSLDELDRLASLALRDNALTGSIPPDLWGLSSLEDLMLGGNRLTGEIPTAVLAMREGAPRAQVNLADNQLNGFATEPIPHSTLGREIEFTLDGNRLDQLPPPDWRATGSLYSLTMSGNRLAGALDLSNPWPELKRLDLSGNQITAVDATNGDALPDLIRLDLAENAITDWPSMLPALGQLRELELSGNRLSGELPDWFGNLELSDLGLDNNDLTGPVADLFQAFDLDDFPEPGPHGELGLRLHVANNRFYGPLPDIDFNSFNSPFQGQSPEFGLDLCFNPIELPSPDRLEAVEAVHRGLALQSCIDRQQAAMDPTVSGSWYQPGRNGEGVTLMLLDNGQLLHYWFTYTPSGEGNGPGQMWLLDVTDPGPSSGEFRPLWITTGGRFGHGLTDGSSRPSRAWVRQNRIDDETLHFFYDYRGIGFCFTGFCFWDVQTDRFDQTRLSRLAGTSCSNQSTYQHYAGAWYNPERAGEGFIVEVLPDDRIVVYWFTYQPDDSGRQAWMIGDGDLSAAHPAVDPPPPWKAKAELKLHQPKGADFGRLFDLDDVQVVEWGDFLIEFNDEDTGHVYWESEIEGYGAGDYPVERLARPMLAECD